MRNRGKNGNRHIPSLSPRSLSLSTLCVLYVKSSVLLRVLRELRVLRGKIWNPAKTAMLLPFFLCVLCVLCGKTPHPRFAVS